MEFKTIGLGRNIGGSKEGGFKDNRVFLISLVVYANTPASPIIPNKTHTSFNKSPSIPLFILFPL